MLCCFKCQDPAEYYYPTNSGSAENEILKRFLDRGVCWGLQKVPGKKVFAPIFIITLDSTPIRHARMIANLSECNVEATICIMTQPDDVVYDEYLRSGGTLSRGELGCAASHAWVLRHAEKTCERILVFEDDADFRRDLFDVELQTRDLVLLGASDWHLEKRRKQDGFYHANLADGRICGTFAYLVTRAFAKKLVAALRLCAKPADHAFHDLLSTVKVIWPPLAIADRSTTSIENHQALSVSYTERCLRGLDLVQYNRNNLDLLQSACSCLSAYPAIKQCRICRNNTVLETLTNVWHDHTISYFGKLLKGNMFQIPKSVQIYSNDIAVAIASFNPCNYKKPRENLRRTIQQFTALNIPVFVLEAFYITTTKDSLLNRASAGKSAAFFQICTSSYMFHKENMWSILLPKIPSKFKKIVFLDGDILIPSPEIWLARVSAALEEKDILQPFSSVLFQENARGTKLSKQPLLVAANHFRDKPFDASMAYPSPGYGVAVNRSWLEAVGGFVEEGVVGAGDLFLFDSLLDPAHLRNTVAYRESPFAHKAIARFQKNAKDLNTKLGFVPQEILHLYHGQRQNRQYTSRHEKMRGLTRKDLRKNYQGLWEFDAKWSKIMLEYFTSRKEDN